MGSVNKYTVASASLEELINLAVSPEVQPQLRIKAFMHLFGFVCGMCMGVSDIPVLLLSETGLTEAGARQTAIQQAPVTFCPCLLTAQAYM